MIATGIYSTYQSGKSKKDTPIALRQPYLRVLGLEIDTDGTGRGARNFTAEEEEEFSQMARSDGFYERFANSIAPSIYGNTGERDGTLAQNAPNPSSHATQTSKRPLRACCSVARKKSYRTACDYVETSTYCCSVIPVLQSLSCSNSSRKHRPSRFTHPAKVHQQLV